MDSEIIEKVTLSVNSITNLGEIDKQKIISESLDALRDGLIFRSTDLSSLINSSLWDMFPIRAKIKLDLEVGFKDLPNSDDELDNRKVSFGNRESTYILLLKVAGGYRAIGNAVALSSRYAITAKHHREKSSDRFILSKVPLLDQSVLYAEEFMNVDAIVVEGNDIDDWMLLQLSSPKASFLPHISPICAEENLPEVKDYLTSRFFTVGLLGNNKISLTSCQRRLVHYCAAPKPEQSKKRKFESITVTTTTVPRAQLKTSLRTGSVDDNTFVEVVGGNMSGSCGSGYFARNGALVAIHLGDVDDAETLVLKEPAAENDNESSFCSRSGGSKRSKSVNSNSNYAHSQGMVLCRMRSYKLLCEALAANVA